MGSSISLAMRSACHTALSPTVAVEVEHHRVVAGALALREDHPELGMFYRSVGTRPSNSGRRRNGKGRTDCTAYLENRDSYSRNGRTTALALASFHCQRVTDRA
jgi:hypothetical protein